MYEPWMIDQLVFRFLRVRFLAVYGRARVSWCVGESKSEYSTCGSERLGTAKKNAASSQSAGEFGSAVR